MNPQNPTNKKTTTPKRKLLKQKFYCLLPLLDLSFLK